MTKKFPPTPEELNLTQEQMIREMYLDRRKSEWPQDVDAYMITTEELEDITGLCRKTFERMRERGELECVKLGHKVRYSLMHLMKVAQSGLFPRNKTMVLSKYSVAGSYHRSSQYGRKETAMIDLAQVIPSETSAEHRLELEKCLSQLFSLLIRIFIPGFSLLSPVSDEEETYGLNPEAQYNDQEFQQMLGVTDKTTYRWRKNELIAYFKGAGGGKGGKIWYTGQAIIDFYRTYRVAKRLKLLKPIFKEIPKGHV